MINISYRINSDFLFKDVNLHLKHKDKIAIIGPNGAGKTTLLKIISGLKKANSGSIEIFHERIVSEKEFEKVRKKIGLLFQNPDDQLIFPNVKDDIAFGLFNLGFDKATIQKRVDNVIKTLHIEHLADKVTFKLSGGEKKLVALAGILVCEPEILLLDEPSAGLDNKSMEKIGEIIKSLDKTVLIVSHNLEFVKQITDKIFQLTSNGLKEIQSL
ncbi:ABC transporter ATP-binding protein [Deferribacter thermophilus]